MTFFITNFFPLFFSFFFGGGQNTDLLEMELLFEETNTFVDILIVQGLDLEFSEFADGVVEIHFFKGIKLTHKEKESNNPQVGDPLHVVSCLSILSRIFDPLFSVVSDEADGLDDLVSCFFFGSQSSDPSGGFEREKWMRDGTPLDQDRIKQEKRRQTIKGPKTGITENDLNLERMSQSFWVFWGLVALSKEFWVMEKEEGF